MSVSVAETRPVEELALFNPAFLALLVRRAADDHEQRSGGRGLPTMLAYIVVPLVLHGPTRRTLPSNVTAHMASGSALTPRRPLAWASARRRCDRSYPPDCASVSLRGC